MSSKIHLDLRGLPPRERHQRILQTFESLGVGEAFEIVNDHDPHTLHHQLQHEKPRQFRWECGERGPEIWKITVVRVPEGMGEVEDSDYVPQPQPKPMSKPDWVKNLNPSCDLFLDVRPMVENGLEPFQVILKTLKELKPGQHFQLVDSVEPTALYPVLARMGFIHYTEFRDGAWNCYFKKASETDGAASGNPESAEPGSLFDRMMTVGPRVELDVRNLPAPEPLMKILENLPAVAEGGVLLVRHQKESKQLMDKLRERGFDTASRKMGETHYQILVWKKS